MRFLTMTEIIKTGAIIVTDAALRLPQSVPYIPVNSWMPTGAVFATDLVSANANKKSFQERIELRIAPVASAGTVKGKRIFDT